MSERAQAFGGVVEISGVPGRGTSVTVRLPRPPPAAA
jgi:signal transduction histidine kinase